MCAIRSGAAIAILTCFVSSPVLADPLKASEDFNRLPTPVQSYVLRLGVEQGLKNPVDVSIDEKARFQIPLPASDLNMDGREDYYAAACMFSPVEAGYIYQTNGFPCAYAALILSTPWGGYDFLDTSGLLVDAKAGQTPTVTVYQRNFNDCGNESYMCNAEYSV